MRTCKVTSQMMKMIGSLLLEQALVSLTLVLNQEYRLEELYHQSISIAR